MVVHYNPFDAEYGDDPAPNGTMLILRNGTLFSNPPGWENRSTDFPFLAEWHSAGDEAAAMLDIYTAGVGGVIIVGAVFSIGLIAALALAVWRLVSTVADWTVECLLWTQYRCRQSRCCGSRSYTVDATELEEESLGSPRSADDRSDGEPESSRVAE